MRVATAPVSYGVFEITADAAGLPDPDDLAAAMAASGYVGTELGPPGYFGTGPEVRQLLGRHGLALVGSFLPLAFSRRELFEADLRNLDSVLDSLAEAADGPRPVVLLSDAFREPERLEFAGDIERHREAWLPAERERLLHANAQRAAERCRERGFDVAFHYHAGTYVETPREIAAFVAAVDAALLPLCFDSGHSAFGGGDPLAFLREYGELVRHAHLKDVDLELLADIHRRGAGLQAAWAEGVFCALGTGGANVAQCLDELRGQGYDGWLVVEQDRILGPGDWDAAVDEGARNREFLRERGV
jgi:inosose dehydratase